MHEMHQ
jgi:hypothetical protein